MFTWLDFAVLTLAASAVVDVWFNGSLFSDWRAFFQSHADDFTPLPGEQEPDTDLPPGDPLPRAMQIAEWWLPKWVGDLLSCDFCFSHHTPWIVGVVLFFPAMIAPWLWLSFLLKLPAYSLAATRLGNIINSLIPENAKYRR